MPIFVADFRTQPILKKKAPHPLWKTCVFEAEDYKEASRRAFPAADWLNEHEPAPSEWWLAGLSEFDGAYDDDKVSDLPDASAYENRYYFPLHAYQYMAVEGTRLMGLPSDGRNEGYGSLVQDMDTGAMSYAATNGVFYTNIPQKNLELVLQAFAWKPIVFPCRMKDGEPEIDWAHYITSNTLLYFPLRFWGSESFDKQVLWIVGIEAAEARRSL